LELLFNPKINLIKIDGFKNITTLAIWVAPTGHNKNLNNLLQTGSRYAALFFKTKK
jgi:hypothetical protein